MRFAVVLTSLLTVAMALPSTKDITPVVEFTLTESKGEIPLNTDSSIESRQVPRQNPTISFFPGPDCASGGMRLSIVDRQYGVCLAPMPPQYRSFIVDNPSAIWLPYMIYVGSCASLIEVPRTNTCYNLNGAPGTGWEKNATGGGTWKETSERGI
ncbi:hypothetical protein BDN72DRAFT_879049 [Pluteus cervinus]|uniref:Uncharacterized protein n=1 Tax=Pluteus cervinus TaxID=181527 RepID=A0ACD3ARN5_9AGAR|nr:hypothetical protein BDN72DRAFT_879049 [Pluteus cervinus]